MNPLARRRFLALAALAPIVACGPADGRSRFAWDTFAPISPEELELIVNSRHRQAHFARLGLPTDGPLVIRNRVFGSERDLLRNQKIENVHFIECSFEGIQGYGNDLREVTFEACRFVSGVISGERWQDVRLLRCTGVGRFSIAARHGQIRCEDCNFRGLSMAEAKLGHWPDHFAFVGSFERSSFVRCTLDYFSTRGSKSLEFIECKVNDLYGDLASEAGNLTIHRCNANHGTLEFSGRGNQFSSIRITDSQLDTVKFVGVQGDTLDVAGSTLNLFLGGTRFDRVTLANSSFGNREAIDAGIDIIGDMTIDRCRFAGRDASLRLCGEPEHKPPPGTDPIAWSRYRTLTLRHTEVPKAELAYLQVGTLTLDHSTLTDTDLSHSRIGTLRLQSATLNGALDLRNSTIRRIDNQGLNNLAAVTGSLESTPQAPEPDVTGVSESSASPAS